jgi:hypothetical protein
MISESEIEEIKLLLANLHEPNAQYIPIGLLRSKEAINLVIIYNNNIAFHRGFRESPACLPCVKDVCSYFKGFISCYYHLKTAN